MHVSQIWEQLRTPIICNLNFNIPHVAWSVYSHWFIHFYRPHMFYYRKKNILWFLSMCKLQRITHKLNIKLSFYFCRFYRCENIDCRRGDSNEYPQSMFWAEIGKISEFFIWKFSVFGDEIFYIFIWIGMFSYFIFIDFIDVKIPANHSQTE